MKRLIIVLVLTLCGCGGGGGGSDSGTTNGTIGGTNTDPRQAVINLVYNDLYTVPVNFRVDREERIYQLRYSLTDTRASLRGLEICYNNSTDFFQKSYQWANGHNGHVISGALTNTLDDYYYETDIQIGHDDGTSETVYVRAFKCEKFTLGEYGREFGVQAQQPWEYTNAYNPGGKIGPEEDVLLMVVDVFEYLYTVGDWNGKTVKVLETSTYEEADSYAHELKIAFVEPGTTCDVVEVGFWRYTTNKAVASDGYYTIIRSYKTNDRFKATNANGTPQVCN